MNQAQLRRSLLPIALALAVWAPGAAGQELRGLVIETGSLRPLQGIEVAVLDADRERVATTMTDRDGRFALRPPAGEYFVYAVGLSHTEMVAGPLEIPETGFVEVKLRLEAVAVTLGDSLLVSVEGNKKLEAMGFYRRRRRAVGVFLSDEDIRLKTNAVTVSQLLVGLPGIKIDNTGIVTLTGMMTGSGYCPYSVYIDGARRVSRRQPNENWAKTLIRPDEVAGIEVYRRIAEVPIQYSGSDAGCGVILIWTQRR